MRILFVTRKYPPSTGGMETVAYELYMALAANKDNRVTLVKWGGSNNWLPIVYPWLFIWALMAGIRERPDVIYLQDGIMGPLGLLLKWCLRRPTLMTIHGKEVTFNNPVYRAIVLPCIKRQGSLVAISRDTEHTLKRTFSKTDTVLIPNGVNDDYYASGESKEQHRIVADIVGMSVDELDQHHLILTVGRLVRRKGVLWFIENALADLIKVDPSVLYLVSGDGKDREAIETAITTHKLRNHVKMLGRTTDTVKAALYNVSDIFLMPNIPVSHDMEGLGMVALEAATCGTLVVASNLEGIPDAIQDGKNGMLFKPNDASGLVRTLKRELNKRGLAAQAVREYTLAHYAWSKRAHEYESVMQKLIA
ncbi:MAG TPA: glycosyltransferase family 4 protein [Candidatus Saccharimonadia bacterium]|nr:glycosyltransferase family 4 protein [Candidatus Saccharimonadia bacterium]